MENNDVERINCYGILNKVIDILNNIGSSMKNDSNNFYKKEYSFDKLRIIYNNKSEIDECIRVFIDNINVFDYNFSDNKYQIIKGKWIQLIELIHSRCVLNDNISDDIISRNYAGLNELQNYFKYYIKCYDNRSEFLEILNNELNKNNISILKRSRNKSIINKNDDSIHIDYSCFHVYFNKEKVAEFDYNIDNLFPDKRYFAENYKSGKWTNILRDSVLKVVKMEMTQQKIDNYSNDMINKFNSNINIKR